VPGIGTSGYWWVVLVIVVLVVAALIGRRFAGPVRGSASWSRDGTPDDAIKALVAYGRTHNARVRADGSQVTLNFGSRVIYRFMGPATWRVPYVVRVSAVRGPGLVTRLTAAAYSSPGPFIAYRGEGATLNYKRRFTATLGELQQQ
jgi:hypothetical protein